jgi:lipopolysaccharide transport system permease protein
LTYYGARRGWQLIDFAELWASRELIWAFGFRDLRVRYRQAMVGVAWAVLQPLLTIIVFGVLLNFLKSKPSDGAVPYVVTGLCGLVPWQFFSASVSLATLSISSNNQLLKKVYFPRAVLPLSAFVPAMVDFGVAFVLLASLMAYYGILPAWQVVFLPVLILMTAVTSAAFGFWLSALNGIYRDVQFALPFMLQMGMMVSPVVYETDEVIPEAWHSLYYLNPMAGLLQCYRAILLDSSFPNAFSISISFAAMLLLLTSGLFYFRRMEKYFADVS